MTVLTGGPGRPEGPRGPLVPGGPYRLEIEIK